MEDPSDQHGINQQMIVLCVIHIIAFGCTVKAAPTSVSGLSGTYFDNAMLLPRDEAALEPCGRVDALSSLAPMSTSTLPCGGPTVFSARWDGAFAPDALEDGVSYDLALSTNVPVRMWVRTWKLIDEWTNGPNINLLESQWNFTASSKLNYTIRLEVVSRFEVTSLTSPTLPTVQLLWRRHSVQTSYEPVPDAAVLPQVRDSERERQTLQRKLARGWNTWHRASAASHVHLPSGLGLSLSLQQSAPAPKAAPVPSTPLGQCGSYLNNTGCMRNDIPGSRPVDSMAECCALCLAEPRCAVATWNGPVGKGPHHDSTCNLKFSGSCQAPIAGQTFVRVRPEPPAPTPRPMILKWNAVDKCMYESECTVRPGPHSYNGSYTVITQRVKGAALNFTISSAHLDGTNGDGLVLLVRANDTAAARAAQGSWKLVADVGFNYFDCPSHPSFCGQVRVASANATSIMAQPTGFDAMIVRAVPSSTSAVVAGQTLSLAFDANGLACIVASSTMAATIDSTERCAQLLHGVAHRYEAEMEDMYPRKAVGSNRDVADAVRAVVGWNIMWDSRVKVVAPVARDFGVQPYSIWLWDTYFLSLLAGESSMEHAFSNVIEVTRPTVYGDVPGIRTATEVALDRSKPFVGALIVREHYRRWGKLWLVDLLFDDLLIWTNWIRDRRTLAVTGDVHGQGLIALGSDNLTGVHVQSGSSCSRTHAIWESGLDNSPMYDNLSVQPAPGGQPCLFPLYDVGMTGLYLAQCDALADLADVLNRTADAIDLRSRVKTMGSTLNEWLWQDKIGIYSNRFSNSSAPFFSRISPFNFHPMLSGTASEEQARRMVTDWLMGDQGFCLGGVPTNSSGSGRSAGAANGKLPQCKFGLPSIARSDPAFTDQTYWRGRTWGPMNFLVYMGLAHPRYHAVAEVQQAKAALANASRALLLQEWLDKHHVHENYNAMTGTGGDKQNSNPMYTWGALLGYIALAENGLLPHRAAR